MPSLEDFIEAFSGDLAFNREHRRLIGIVDSLHNLAVMEAYRRNLHISFAYLDEAEEYLRDLDDEKIAQICVELRTKNPRLAHHYVLIRREKLLRLRQKLQRKK